MMEPIQLFVPSFRIEETLAEIRICLEKGWTGLGFKTVEFEDAWKQYTGLPHAHFLNSATSGLHLAVQVLKDQYGWQAGDEIITTPLTFISTNHAILYEDLQPVFADVDEYLCLDPSSIAERITPRTRAVMFVGMGGNTGRFRDVIKLCKKHNLKLILDASHMTGTRWKGGGHVGGEADVSIFSFQAVKNLPTADSGMICFREAHLDEDVRKWTWLGINKDTYARTTSQGTYKWHYDVEHVGFKYHGNSIMAAIGLVSIRYVDPDNAYRRQLADWYDEMLSDEPRIQRVPMSPDCVPSRHLYQVEVDHRDEVMLALNQAKIYPGVHYRDNTSYRMYAYAQGTCPRSYAASERIISLPMHMHLSYQHIQYITRSLKEIVQHLER
jgi:dTDP-4-amino-4,6-dideoxygalactose transaminase